MALTQIKSEGIKDSEVKNADMADDAVGIAELSATGTASSSTFLRGDNSWATPTDTNTQLSPEEVQDIVGAMFTGNTETNITATYQDSDGTIDLVSTNTQVGGATGVDFNNDVKARFGTGNDLEIFHNGTDAFINSTTGHLDFQVDGAKKMRLSDGGDLQFDNSRKIELGTSQDLQIYHDGSDSFVKNTTNKDLIIHNTGNAGIQIKPQNSYPVELYYNGALRALTTANGYQVQQAAGADVEFRIKNSTNTNGDATNYILSEHDGRTTAKIVFGRNGDANDFSASAATTQGDIQFFTTASGTNTKRARFINTGYFHADADSGSFASCDNTLHAFRSSTNNWALRVINSHASTPYGIHAYFNNSHPDDETSRFFNGSDDQTSRILIYANGDIENHDGSYGQTSDIKLKENIVDANSQWDDIKAVRVRNFNFKISPDKKQIGVVAQELETVSPGLVSTHKDLDENLNDLGTTTKSVKSSILYMKAIKALQEAMARIETLETEKTKLQTDLTALTARVAALEAG